MNGATARTARPVRILMYTAYFDPEYSGAALQALTLAKELRQRGHHVEFVTIRWPGLGEKAVVEQFPVQRLELGRARKHREFRLWFNLARYVWTRRDDFDVLHSHGAYFTNAFVGPLARIVGMKSLIKASLAHDDLEGLRRPLLGRLHRYMLRCIDGHIAISQDLVEEFRAGGVAEQNIHYVPNGVDIERFCPVTTDARLRLRAGLGLPLDQRIALFVGVLDERKNVTWLAKCWLKQQLGTQARCV